MTTTAEAIENAARMLRNKEISYRAAYGGTGGVSLELGIAWTELAKVISEHEREKAATDD